MLGLAHGDARRGLSFFVTLIRLRWSVLQND